LIFPDLTAGTATTPPVGSIEKIGFLDPDKLFSCRSSSPSLLDFVGDGVGTMLIPPIESMMVPAGSRVG
jgi:hypothetical protein